MQRNRLKNIINKSKELSNKRQIGEPFDEFKNSLPKELEIGDNYRLKAAWKAYGSPKDYREALWGGMIQPIDENTFKLPSIGYNEETDEYEYLNKGEDNETVAKDIRVWDNDVIPLVQELKLGGYVRTFNKEKDCWTYSKNSQKREEPNQNGEQQVTETFQKGGKSKKDRSLEELIEYAMEQNPRFIQRMSEPIKDIEFIDVNGIKSRGTHYMVNDEVMVYPTIQEMPDGSLKYFEDIDAAYKNAKQNNNILYFNSKEEAVNFAKNYKQGWPKFFGKPVEIDGKTLYDIEGQLYSFKQGGQMSVIPEGALHARKNNMEGAGEEFTAKGIPVVDNNGEQQAEIERNELILSKLVTDKVEELYKKFNEEESQSKKDEIAIKMGKIITCELMTNTDDRTGLIEEVKEKM